MIELVKQIDWVKIAAYVVIGIWLLIFIEASSKWGGRR